MKTDHASGLTLYLSIAHHTPTDILFLKHDRRIFRPNPVCGFSMMEQVRLCAVWPRENWLGSSMNQKQAWMTIWECCRHVLEKRCLLSNHQPHKMGELFKREMLARSAFSPFVVDFSHYLRKMEDRRALSRSFFSLDRVRTGLSKGNQLHISDVWWPKILKMYMGTLGYQVQTVH